MTNQIRTSDRDAVTDPAGIAAEEFARRYQRLQATYAEAQARTTNTEELGRWQQRSIRLQRLHDTIDQRDLHQLLDANSVLHAQQQLVAEHIDVQVANRLY